MAFPSLTEQAPTADSETGGAASGGNGGGSTHEVLLPATVNAGDLLMVFGRCTTSGTISITGGGWTINQHQDGSGDVTFWGYRDTLAAGTEDGNAISVNHGSAKLVAHTMAIGGAEDPAVQPPEASAVATGNSNSPNPTACTPTGGAKEYLWIWFGGWEGEQTLSKSPPTGMTDGPDISTGTAGGAAGNCQMKTATRQTNASSRDEGNITLSGGDDWTAWTIAVHPEGVAGIDETGRIVDITSTVTGIDQADFEDPNRAVDITSTVTETDQADFEDPNRTVDIAATVTVTDGLGYTETLPVDAATAVTVTDQLDLDDLALPTTGNVTVTETDRGDFTDQLAVDAASTITVVDHLGLTEPLAVDAVSTITETDRGDFTDPAAVTIVSTITSTDETAGSLTELELPVTIAATVTETDQADFTDSAAVSVASTVTETDQAGFEDQLATVITSTITSGDLASYTEQLAAEILATITGQDIGSGDVLFDVTFDTLGPVIQEGEALAPTLAATDGLAPAILAVGDPLGPEAPAPDANPPATIRPATDPAVVRPAADPEIVDHAEQPAIR